MKQVSRIIDVGQTETLSFSLNESTLTGFTAGSSITGSKISFLVSIDNENYYSLFDKDTEVTVITGSYNRAYALDHTLFYSWKQVKLQLGDSASAIAQETDPLSIVFSLREY